MMDQFWDPVQAGGAARRMTFFRIFWRLLRRKVLAVGVLFLGIFAVLAALAIAEGSYLPASGTIASVERTKKDYQVIVETSRDGATTPVMLTLSESAFGRAPVPSDQLQFFQSPSRPDRVSMVGLAARLRDAAVFLGIGLLLTWLGLGARLPKRQAEAQTLVASEVRSPLPADQPRSRNEQPIAPGGRRVFGRR